MPEGQGRDELASMSEYDVKNIANGIVPDLAITPAGDLKWGEAGAGERILADIKFLSAGFAYTQTASTRSAAAVQARQDKVDWEYRNKAIRLDEKYFGHSADAPTPGPV